MSNELNLSKSVDSQNYIQLEKELEKLLSDSDILINLSESLAASDKTPIIDRGYFMHIFNIGHLISHMLYDELETTENLKKINLIERQKYLLGGVTSKK